MASTSTPTTTTATLTSSSELAQGLTRLQDIVSRSVQSALTSAMPSLMDAVEQRVDTAVQHQLASLPQAAATGTTASSLGTLPTTTQATGALPYRSMQLIGFYFWVRQPPKPGALSPKLPLGVWHGLCQAQKRHSMSLTQ